MKLRGIIVIAAVFSIAGYLVITKTNLIPKPADQKSVDLKKTELAQMGEEDRESVPTGTVDPASYAPTTKAAAIAAPRTRMLQMGWVSQMGINLANGGAKTTEGSLMHKRGVNLEIIRQDDVEQMKTELVKCAAEMKSSGKADCRSGAQIVAIMGDGAAAFFASVNGAEMLGKLGPDYHAAIFGSAGRSFGEDKFMGPAACKDDPKKCRGLLISGYLRDGDWNLAIFWAAQNEICNNPDEKTYDPECLNWYSTSDFIKAAEAYNTTVCEDRPVVRNDKRTGEVKKVCVGGTVTWTPGDVAVAEGRGGLVSLISTKENESQMPNVMIGVKKWIKGNKTTVKDFLSATFEGGTMIRRSDVMLTRAAAITAKIYADKDAGYWKKYYKGAVENDITGLEVSLGGSRVHTLADNIRFFGLAPGRDNLFAHTYKVFGDYVVVNYPKLVPDYPALETVVDFSALKELMNDAPELAAAKADEPTFAEGEADPSTGLVGQRNWSITFVTGSAEITKSSSATLEELHAVLSVASNTKLEVRGHTDDVGPDETNLTLSKARAEAVRAWLQRKAPTTYSTERFGSVRGYGESQPLVNATTAAARAKNRRVEIIIRGN